jgi:hypothetical protein
MQSMLKKIGFLIVLLGWAQAYGQEAYQIGAVVCKDQVTLLDYYEGRVLRNLNSPDNLNLKDLLTLAPLGPDRSKTYVAEQAQFLKLFNLSGDNPTGEIPSEDLILKAPAGCQIPVLLKTNFRDQFLINKELWNALSITDQSGVVMNWSLAKEIFLQKQKIPTSSIYIRNLNSLMPGRDFIKMTFPNQLNVVKAAGLSSMFQQGILFDLTKEYTVEDGILLKAYPIKGSDWVYSYNSVNSISSLQFVKLKGDEIEFYSKGEVKSLRFEGQLILGSVAGKISLSTPDDVKNSRIYFHPNGQLMKGLAAQNNRFKTEMYELQYAAGTWITFYPDGLFESLSSVSGKINFEKDWITLVDHSKLELYNSGLFKEFSSPDSILIVVQDQKSAWTGALSFDENGVLNCGQLDENFKFLNKFWHVVNAPKGNKICFDEDKLMKGIQKPN